MKVWIPKPHGTLSYPPANDVGVREGDTHEELWLVGQDGTLFFEGPDLINPTISFSGQLPGPGDLTRVAVAQDRSAWFISSHGIVWHRHRDGRWMRVPESLGNL